MKRHVLIWAIIAFIISNQPICFAQDKSTRLETSILSIKAHLDYSKVQDGESDPIADKLFSQLEKNKGKVVELYLKITPAKESAAKGYTLKYLRQNQLDAEKESTSDNTVSCGDGLYGVLENYRDDLILDFQHPSHFHSPTKVFIGNRMNHPRNSAACSTEGYMQNDKTPLYVRGSFVVEAESIPTAIEYVLFPVNP